MAEDISWTPGIACLESRPNILDKACLSVHNADQLHSIDLFAQSKECYKCSFWHLATLSPNGSVSLIVNTTYPTLFSTQQLKSHLYGFQTWFEERGSYKLTLDRSSYTMKTMHEGDSPYYALFYAALFYFFLMLMWIFGNFLKSRMESPEVTERTPILSAPQDSNSPVQEESAVSSTENTSGLTGLPSSYLTSSSDRTTDTLPSAEIKRNRSGKLLSLDVFRGFTIFLMIFVNYGGGQYYFFRHAPWNGLTVADLVFPWFVWIMGVSMMFSFRSQLQRGASRQVIILKIFRRSIILFGLGLFVNGIHNSNVPTLRIPGVLQRLGGCYLFTGIMEVLLFTHPEQATVEMWGGWFMFRDLVQSWLQWSIVFGVASIHTILTYVMKIPDCPRGYLGPGGLADYEAHKDCTGGAAAYIDRIIFSSDHLYRGSSARHVYENSVSHDPEGLLGYLTTILMLELGVAAGRVLLTFDDHKNRIVRMLSWALSSGLVGGVLCNFSKEEGIVPVNKNLWSLSYVLITASFAFVLFSLIYLVTDWFQKWNGGPFSFAGYNSILLYIGHELTKGIFPFGWTPVGSSHGTHLLMNLWGASLWMLIAYACHRNKFYLSV